MPSNAPALNVAGRFAHIDAMRAFAVLIVVLAHAGLGHIVPGGSGVTIFFTVSGFIITYLLLRERDKTGGFSVGGFYFRRAAKIFPPFAVIIIVPTLVWAMFNPLSWGAFASQVFFTFNWVTLRTGDQGILPGSGVVWSLAIEEQFYIAFALIWLAFVRASWWRLATAVLAASAILIATALRLVLAASPGSEDRIYFGTDTRMDGIAIGVLAALLFHLWDQRGTRDAAYSQVIGSDLAFAGAIIIYVASLVIRDDWFRDTFRFTFQSIAAAVIILYGMFPRRGPLKHALFAVSAWKPVAIIGLASYSIYLVHLIVDQFIRGFLAGWPLLARTSVLVIVGLAAGIAVYYLIEIPVLRWRNHQKTRRLVSRVEQAGQDTGI